MITLERILLQTIKFDLQVDHPYSWLLKFAKLLKGQPLHTALCSGHSTFEMTMRWTCERRLRIHSCLENDVALGDMCYL